MDKWGRLAWEARRQLGVVHIRQAEELGIARQTLARRAAESGWKRLHPGVYLLPAFVPDDRTLVMAAVLAVGEPVAASGRTAAALWGLVEAAPRPVQVVVPHGRPVRTLPGVRVVRSRTLVQADLVRMGPLPVTRIDRTLCDLAGVLGEDELREAVALAGQRSMQWPRRAAVRATELDRLPGRRLLLATIRDVLGEGRTDSVLERRVRRILRAHGFVPAAGVYPVLDHGRLLAMADIAFPEERVLVEVDGFAYHATPAQLAADHRRQNRLEAAGWRVLRVSAADLATRQASEELLRRVCGTLGRGAPATACVPGP